MKKILSFIIVLLLTIVFIGSVKAKSSDLEITNVEILEKSDSVKANIENYKDLNINMNTLFFNKDDYVKYKISIKNNTNNTMKIDDILDNFNSEVLETSYDIDKKELKSNEEYTFTMTIKCIKDIEEERVTIKSPLSIIINYDNGKTATIDINPNTKDSIITYFIIFVLSAISLLLVINKKGKKQLLGLMLLVSLIPIGSNAVSTKKTLTINNDIKVYGRTAVFKTGLEINKQLKDLAGTDTSTNVNVYNIVDTNIKEFKRSNELPDGFIPSEENTISTNDSRIPIYAWFDNGTIYYYTEASNPLFNEDEGRAFSFLSELINVELDTIDTSNSNNISGLFFNCRKIKQIDLSSFNTSNVTNFMALFMNCYLLENVDVSSFNTQNVTNMAYLFENCQLLNSIDLSNFNTQNVTNMQYMFTECSSLKELNLSNFNTSSVITMYCMFGNCYELEQLDLSGWNTRNVENMSWMFWACRKLKSIDVSSFNTESATNMHSMFGECISLEELDLSNFNTTNVIDMGWMFGLNTANESKLTKLDLSSFDIKNVEDMSYMFQNCSNLEELDLSSFNNNEVSNVKGMFYNCRKLKTLLINNFNTSKVINMESMFTNCYNLEELDISNFDTSNVESFGWMFYGCKSLKKLDLYNFNTSKAQKMNSMFNGCESLTELNVSSFDTSKVTTMGSMFAYNKFEEIDLSSFDTKNVTDMSGMFYANSNLKTIYASDNFVTNSVTVSTSMFHGDSNLKGGNGTPYNNSYKDKTYARIDTEETPGYFTLKSA